ncbi:MAG: tetratricopeptide repeat protein [Verrucomicrobiota bacterium]|nr:tetratricopeptide repeat protein [Verrucomicrobiota bacterium]
MDRDEYIQKSTGEHLNRGNVYFTLGKYEEAFADYTKVIELNPENAVAHFNRGSAYAKIKKYEEAIADFDRAIELNPAYEEAYNNRGNAYAEIKKYKEALADYTKAVALNPAYAGAHFNRGSAYAEIKKYKEALADFDRAIALNPTYAEAYNNRGIAYAKIGKYKEALADYTKAIELNSEYAVAYLNRGNAYQACEKYEEALVDYTKAIELNSEYAVAYLNRGNAYLELKKCEEALADFEKAIRLDPAYRLGLDFLWRKISNSKQWKKVLKWSIWQGRELEEWGDYFWALLARFVKEKKKEPEDIPVDLVNAVKELYDSLAVVDDPNGDNYIVKIKQKDRPADETPTAFVYQHAPFSILETLAKERCLWLTPACYQNDPEEGNFIFSYLRDTIKRAKSPQAGHAKLHQVLDACREEAEQESHIAFIRSLSCLEDRVLMWNSSYAENGGGMALGVHLHRIRTEKQSGLAVSAIMLPVSSAQPSQSHQSVESEGRKTSEPSPPPPSEDGPNKEKKIPLDMLDFRRVLYLPTKAEEDKKAMECVGKVVKKLQEWADLKKTPLSKEDLYLIFLPVAHLIKNESYRHEAECRLVYLSTMGSAKPYLHGNPADLGVHLETEAFLFDGQAEAGEEEHIYLGPKVDGVKLRQVQHHFKHALENPISIRPSKIKFR